MKDAHFYFNILGSEATSLFDVGRWTFDVGRSFSYKKIRLPLFFPSTYCVILPASRSLR